MARPLFKLAALSIALASTFHAGLTSAASPLAVQLQVNPLPGSAQGFEGEAAILQMFAKLFDRGDQTPIDPAQLELGRATAAALLPEGAYGQMMDQVMATILKPIFAMDPGFNSSKIASATGMDLSAAESLSSDQRKAIEAILDPGRDARTQGALDTIRPLIMTVGKQLEPPMREGLARAYARRLSAAQLTEMNQFFATPTGSAFARESFSIQYDPEVLSATMQAMPVMLGSIMNDAAGLEAKLNALPKERRIGDLAKAEMDKLAQLTGMTPAALLAHAQKVSEPPADVQSAEQMFGADVSADSGPWLDRDNWSDADRARVETLERRASEAINAQIEAEGAAISNARGRLEKKK